MKKTITLLLLLLISSLAISKTYAIVINPPTNYDDGGGGSPSVVELSFNVDPYADFHSSNNQLGHMWLKVTNKTGSTIEVGRMSVLNNESVTVSGNSIINNTYPLYQNGLYIPTHVPLLTYNLENSVFNSSNSSFSGLVFTMSQIVTKDDFEEINDLLTYYTYHGTYSTNFDLSGALLSDIDDRYNAFMDTLSISFSDPMYNSGVLSVIEAILINLPWDIIIDYVNDITLGGSDLYSLAVEYAALEDALFDELIASGQGYILNNTSLKSSYRENLVNLYYESLGVEGTFDYAFPSFVESETTENINRLRYTGFFLNFADNGYIYKDNTHLQVLNDLPGTSANTNFAITIWNYALSIGLIPSYDKREMLFYPAYETIDSLYIVEYMTDLMTSDHYKAYYSNGFSGTTYGATNDEINYDKSFAPTKQVFGYFTLNHGFIHIPFWNEHKG